MTKSRYVLDTNIFATLLRSKPTPTHRVTTALAAGSEFLLCLVVFYEVYRGLLHRDAKKQLNFFSTTSKL